MSYDLADLQLVAAIADCGSLSAAAARVSLAVSSASSRLTRLESTLQVALFSRHARGLTPTPAGETVLRHARQALARLGQLEADLAPYAGGAPGRVTILANSSAINNSLPGDLAEFLRRHPAMQFAIEERPNQEIVRAIAGGEAEVGIAALEIVPAGIDAQRYRTERLVLLVPSGHRNSRAASYSFARLVADEAFVCLNAGSHFHTFMMRAAAACGASLNVRIQVRTQGAVCRMVAAGMGIGVVPHDVARREMGSRETPFIAIPLIEPWAERTLYLCTRHATLTKPAASIVEHLRQCEAH